MTFNFVIPSMFSARASMMTEPTQVISAMIASIKSGASQYAKKTMLPWYTRMKRAEKATPMPKEEANTMDDTKSSMDFAKIIS